MGDNAVRKLNYVENNYFARMSLKELEDVKSGCQKVMGLLFFAFFMSIFLCVGNNVEVPAEGVSALASGEISKLFSLNAIAASIGEPYSLLISTGTVSILLCVVGRIRYGAVLMIATNKYVPDEHKLDASSLEDAVRLVRAE